MRPTRTRCGSPWRASRDLARNRPWQGPEPLEDSRHSRHSRVPPGMSGKPGVRQRSCRPDRQFFQMSGATTPAELLRRLRRRDQAPGGPGSARASGNPTELLRAAGEAAEALAVPDAALARERQEIAAGLRAEAPDPTRVGKLEVLPNGTVQSFCRVCGRLARWGFDVALDRGRVGRWTCFEHRNHAG